MSEPKPIASLSSGLLARKGAARPAMRPQGFGQIGASLEDLGWDDMGFEPPKPVEIVRDASHDAFGEDLVEHPRVHPTGLSPVPSPVHSQQAELAARVADVAPDEDDRDDSAEPCEPQPEAALEVEAECDAPEEPAVETSTPVLVAKRFAPAPHRAPRPRAAPGTKAKAAFTLRLDPARHLKLRLACALDGRSAQHIVTDALDQLLAKMPELDAMATTANRKG